MNVAPTKKINVFHPIPHRNISSLMNPILKDFNDCYFVGN